MKVVIVAENASAKFGGEAILPLHYFRLLRKRGVEAWLVVHARTRGELETVLPNDLDRIHFIPDTWFHRGIEKVAKPFPNNIKHFGFRIWGRLLTAILARRIVRRLVKENQIDVVHQPTPVSPKEPSLMHKLGAPVVIGPMNGGITYPPGFGSIEKPWVRAFISVGRVFSHVINALMPGKTKAALLLVANPRTKGALPNGVHGKVEQIVENGVDLSLWKFANRPARDGEPVRFIFTGRLVDWKGVQFLIDAFATVAAEQNATLEIVGDGPMRSPLQAQVTAKNLNDRIIFHGWKSQAECAGLLASADVFVLPSLYECGGAVVLEAMAVGLPVIATNWGGPADYLDASCGILVDPKSKPQFVEDLRAAMLRLAKDPALRQQMGEAGRTKAAAEFDWERKIDRILAVYEEASKSTL